MRVGDQRMIVFVRVTGDFGGRLVSFWEMAE
jgi:hypothetical protein